MKNHLQIIKNLKQILGNVYFKKFKYLILFMVLGMFFEIFFLNSLVMLLDLLSSSSEKISKTIVFLKKNFGNENLEIKMLIIFLISFFLKTVSNIFINWRQVNFYQYSELFVAKKFFKNYLDLPVIYFQRTNSASVIRKLTEDINNLKMFISSLSILLLEIVVLFGIAIYLLNYNFLISIISILFFILFALIIHKFHKNRFLKYGEEKILHGTKKIKTIIEGLSSLREIKIRGKETEVLENFYQSAFRLAQIGINSSMINYFTRPIFEIFLILIICFFTGFLILSENLTLKVIPILGLYLAASYRLVPSIAKIVQNLQNFQLFSPSIEILLRDQKFFEANNKIKPNIGNFKFTESIELKNISFSYDEEKEKKQIFKNLNFKIVKNTFLGIVGKSGSGKSTLIDLVIGLYKPEKGAILVDGKSIENNIRSWQSIIGCVPQDVYILDESVKKNIAFGVDNVKINDDKIFNSIQFSFLSEFVKNLEYGLETKIGEKGAKISGGQRQRIGIARAIYNNPDILIFDESTNALDNYTEKKIMDEINLLKGKKTIIFISHKKEILKNCDKILDLNEKYI